MSRADWIKLMIAAARLPLRRRFRLASRRWATIQACRASITGRLFLVVFGGVDDLIDTDIAAKPNLKR
ncbi:hypothetical protein LJR263_003636 [Pseudomonas sp. LjRoot263]